MALKNKIKARQHFEEAKKKKRAIQLELFTYDNRYKLNPVQASLDELFDEGKIKISKDERAYLADLLVEKICTKSELMGLGAAIHLRFLTFLKGRIRDDVTPSEKV